MNYPIFTATGLGLKSHTIHPSVVYVPNGWNGHTYWMAETPMPPFRCKPYRDRYELPTILFSDDGLSWQSVSNNPIDNLTDAQIVDKAYLSDTHLILVNNRLECYYRLCEHQDKHTIIYRKTSTDGYHWSERETIADNKDKDIFGKEIISPAIVCRADKYQMFYVDDMPGHIERGIRMAESNDNIRWGISRKVSLTSRDLEYSGTEPSKPWHIDVQFYNNQYHLLIYDFERHLTYWVSNDGLHFIFIQKILEPSHKKGDFFSNGLYRGCMIWKNGQMSVYFSAIKGYSCIGLLQVNKNQSVTILDGCHGKEKIWHWGRVLYAPIHHIYRYLCKKLHLL